MIEFFVCFVFIGVVSPSFLLWFVLKGTSDRSVCTHCDPWSVRELVERDTSLLLQGLVRVPGGRPPTYGVSRGGERMVVGVRWEDIRSRK